MKRLQHVITGKQPNALPISARAGAHWWAEDLVGASERAPFGHHRALHVTPTDGLIWRDEAVWSGMKWDRESGNRANNKAAQALKGV